MKKHQPTLLVLFLVVFLDLIGFGIIIPLLPIYSAKMGASGALLGAAFSCYSLMQFIFAPVWGKLSDRVGRRPIILISLCGSTLSYAIFAFAQNIEMLMVSRLLAGLCGANISVANAYVADITTRENRSKGMGVLGAAFGLGFLFGPALALLASHWSLQAPALIASGLCGLNLILTFFILPESLNREAGEAAAQPQNDGYFNRWFYVLAKPGVGLLVLIGFLFNTAITQWETTFGLFLYRDPFFGPHPKMFMYFLIYVAFLVVLIQGGLIGRITKRFGEIRLLQFGLLMMVLSLGFMPYCRGLTDILLCLTVLALAMGFSRPVMSGAISLLSTPAEQGLVMGVFMGVASLARIVGPLLGGKLLDVHIVLPFLIASGLSLVAWLLALGISKKTA